MSEDLLMFNILEQGERSVDKKKMNKVLYLYMFHIFMTLLQGNTIQYLKHKQSPLGGSCIHCEY